MDKKIDKSSWTTPAICGSRSDAPSRVCARSLHLQSIAPMARSDARHGFFDFKYELFTSNTEDMSEEGNKRLYRAVYPAGTRFQVLLSGSRARMMMEDWLTGSSPADLRVRRARTAGMVVLETTDVVFASRMVQRSPGCRVNIIKP